MLLVGRAEALAAAAAGARGAAPTTSRADVTAPDADERIVATCAEQIGGIDVLVNNAGTQRVRPLEELTDDDWRALTSCTSSRPCG